MSRKKGIFANFTLTYKKTNVISFLNYKIRGMRLRKFFLVTLIFNVCLMAVSLAEASQSSRNVEIIIQPSLYKTGSISTELDQYIADLANEGYTPRIHQCTETTPAALRSYLRTVYETEGLAGAVVIEAVPWASVIPRAYYDDYDPPNDRGPVDLYYMDLDGSWIDNDSDGYFEEHINGTGDQAPEIWVGRLTTTTVSRLQNYFHRNHAYRTGSLTYNERALLYIAQDWSPGTSAYDNIGLAYSDREWVYYPDVSSPDYQTQIQGNYEWHFVAAHGSAWGHQFLSASDIESINPHIAFYHIWSCHSGNFEDNPYYMAGEYVFAGDYGLGALASTNSGGCWPKVEHYQAIADGRSFGEAYYDWCLISAEPDGSYSEGWMGWHWGMSIIGDPTLVPNPIPEPFILPVTGLCLLIVGVMKRRLRKN